MSEHYKSINVKAVADHNVRYSEQLPLFRKSYTFINNIDDIIIAVDRNNIPVVFQADPNRYRSQQVFIIRTIYEFLGTNMARETLLALDNITKQFKFIDENSILLYAILQDSFNKDPRAHVHKVTIERTVKYEDIKRYGCIYDEGSDFLVTTPVGLCTTPHPASIEGKIVAGHEEFAPSKKVSGCLIEVVDNDNKIGVRYVYCAKQLICLKPTNDPTRRSGVYFTKFQNTPHQADSIEPHFMGFEEASDVLGLHKTEEEALTGGSPEFITKRKMHEAQQELEQLKHASEKAKVENRLKEAQLEKELHDLRAEQIKLKEQLAKEEMLRNEEDRKRKEEYARREEIRKEEEAKRREYYEERSYYRKDTSEMFKWIPTLIVGAIGIFAVLMKNKT